MPDQPPAPAPGKGKGKQVFGIPAPVFWGGLAVLGAGIAYFVYKRRAAQQAGQQQATGAPLLIAAGSPTGLSSAQLLTWLHDHQGSPHKHDHRKRDR